MMVACVKLEGSSPFSKKLGLELARMDRRGSAAAPLYCASRFSQRKPGHNEPHQKKGTARVESEAVHVTSSEATLLHSVYTCVQLVRENLLLAPGLLAIHACMKPSYGPVRTDMLAA